LHKNIQLSILLEVHFLKDNNFPMYTLNLVLLYLIISKSLYSNFLKVIPIQIMHNIYLIFTIFIIIFLIHPNSNLDFMVLERPFNLYLSNGLLYMELMQM